MIWTISFQRVSCRRLCTSTRWGCKQRKRHSNNNNKYSIIIISSSSKCLVHRHLGQVPSRTPRAVRLASMYSSHSNFASRLPVETGPPFVPTSTTTMSHNSSINSETFLPSHSSNIISSSNSNSSRTLTTINSRSHKTDSTTSTTAEIDTRF